MRALRIFRTPIALSISSTVALQFFNLLSGIALARGLGPAGRGHIAALAALVISATTLTGLSFPDGAVFFLSRASDDRGRYISASALMALLTAALGSVVLLILAPQLEQLGGQQLTQLWPWLLVPFAVQASNLGVTVLRGLQMHGPWAVLRIATTANYAVILLFMWALHRLNPAHVGLALVIGQGLVALGAFISLRNRLTGLGLVHDAVKKVAGYGLKMHPTTWAGIAREQLDKVVLFYLVPASELGRYVVAVALGTLVVGLAFSLDQVLFPFLARIPKAEDRKAACMAQIRTFFLVVGLAALISMPATPFAVRLLFGAKFATEPLLPIATMMVGLIQAFKAVCNIALKVENRPGILGRNEMIGVAVSLGLMLLIVPRIGIFGAPLASGMGALVALTLTLRKIRQLYGVGLAELLQPRRRDIKDLIAKLAPSSTPPPPAPTHASS